MPRTIAIPALLGRPRTMGVAVLPIVLVVLTVACVPLAAAVPRQSSQAPRQAPHLTETQEARAIALEGRLKCPVCRTQSVRESTSFMALEMRARIRELIADGRTDAEILSYFVDRYGDYILLEPRKSGFGLAAYALPFLAVGTAGILLVLTVLRARRRAGAAAAAVGAGAGDDREPADGAPLVEHGLEERRRVDEELERYSA